MNDGDTEDASGLPSSDGMGLSGLRDQVESFGGTFSNSRELGGRTKFEINLVAGAI